MGGTEDVLFSLMEQFGAWTRLDIAESCSVIGPFYSTQPNRGDTGQGCFRVRVFSLNDNPTKLASRSGALEYRRRKR
eukprot:5645258-Pyramimonas_sp.AAC.2